MARLTLGYGLTGFLVACILVLSFYNSHSISSAINQFPNGAMASEAEERQISLNQNNPSLPENIYNSINNKIHVSVPLAKFSIKKRSGSLPQDDGSVQEQAISSPDGRSGYNRREVEDGRSGYNTVGDERGNERREEEDGDSGPDSVTDGRSGYNRAV